MFSLDSKLDRPCYTIPDDSSTYKCPVKSFVRGEKIALPLTKSQENRQLLFEEKIRRTQALRQSDWGKTEICRELNINSRSYDKITQESYVTPISKAEKTLRYSTTKRKIS